MRIIERVIGALVFGGFYFGIYSIFFQYFKLDPSLAGDLALVIVISYAISEIHDLVAVGVLKNPTP